METLAVVILGAMGFTALWDLVRPDDVMLEYNNALRALVGFCAVGAVLALVGTVAGLSTPWIICIGLAFLVIGAIKELAN